MGVDLGNGFEYPTTGHQPQHNGEGIRKKKTYRRKNQEERSYVLHLVHSPPHVPEIKMEWFVWKNVNL
jgi:hypothetical protein